MPGDLNGDGVYDYLTWDMDNDGDVDKDDYLADVFRPYIGDVVDSMSFIEFAQLTNAWNEASEEEMGATLGE